MDRRKSWRPILVGLGLLIFLSFLAVHPPLVAQADTPLLLVFKRAPNQVLVWVYDAAQGESVSEAEVIVYDHHQRTVASGHTNAHGLFVSAIPTIKEKLSAVAWRGDEVAICFDDQRLDDAFWQEGAKKYRVYIQTNRPFYHAGQKVRFRVVVRRREGFFDYSTPPPDTQVRITLLSPAGDILYDKTPRTTPFGSVKGVASLDEGLPPGLYRFQIEVEGERHSRTFQVWGGQDYALHLETERRTYLSGQVITATVRAGYPSGAPAVGLPIRYKLGAAAGCLGSEEVLGEAVDQMAQKAAIGRGLTDENGFLTVALPAELDQGECSRAFVLEARAADPAEEFPARDFALFPIYQGQQQIELRPERDVIRQGEEITFTLQVADIEERPPGRVQVRYLVEQIGRAGPEETSTEILSSTLTTDRVGQGAFSFLPPRGGLYRATAESVDGQGNRLTAHSRLWVGMADEPVNWPIEEDTLPLVADKKHYRVGETAHVLLPSPCRQATALVTVERERVLSQRVLKLNSDSAILPVPIRRTYAPNVFVSVVLMPPGGAPPRVGYLELAVEPKVEPLAISIVPDKRSYRLGEEAICDIWTVDGQGQPVSAEVSLTVIEPLGQVGEVSAFDTFYGRRPLAVHTALSSGNQVFAEDPGFFQSAGLLEFIWPEAIHWESGVVTDEEGWAQVSFRLPAEPGVWRMAAQGTTANAMMGAAYTDLAVEPELMLWPTRPRFLRAGDEVDLGAVAHNRTDRALEIEADLSLSGLEISASAQPTRTQAATATIPAGRVTRLDWPLTVGQGPTATVRLEARSRGITAEMESTLEVLPFGEEKTVFDAGQIEGQGVLVVSLPQDAVPARLTIEVCPSLAACLMEALGSLRSDRHVEEIASHLWSAVALATTDYRGEHLSEHLKEDLRRLYRAQNDDGGWGWRESDPSGPYVTAYVVHALSQLASTNLAVDAVDERALERGLEFLRRFKTDDLSLAAYILYVLNEHGEGDVALARSLLKREAEMGLWARACLALALPALGRPSLGRGVVTRLADQAFVGASLAHWREERQEGRMMSSDGRTTALILSALLCLDPANPLIPKAVRWLMYTRQGGHWRTTQETAAAITALSAYLASHDQEKPAGRYRLQVNDQVLAEETVTENAVECRTFTTTDLTTGYNGVEVEVEGGGRLYYATTLHYYLPHTSLEATRSLSGPLVERRYPGPEKYQVGDLIGVQLTVESPDEMWHVLVEDPLPAGCEALVDSLEEDSHRWRPQTANVWQGDGQGDRLSFTSAYLTAGKHTYTYLMRATTGGRFRTPPARVQALYKPEAWGRSDSAVLIVDR